MYHHRDQHARIDPASQETHRLRGSPSSGNLLGRSKSYKVGPIVGRREVCDQNRHDAASRGKKDSPFDEPPGLNLHRLSPAVGVALDPPDGSGTKSRRL
jgi:hypothetical protein